MLENLGFTVHDLVVAFLGLIVMLIMMLAFILIGISAFSPTSSFSSVTNSLLPLGAGLSANQKDKSEHKSPEELEGDTESALKKSH